MHARLALASLVLATVIGCTADEDDPTATLSVAELQDPETCRGCHPRHYAEWASSAHAYAVKDPVFTAMNERGQLETDDALGAFCVRCHAPMALSLGLTEDGLNLLDLDDPNARGVTCYFCHDTVDVTGESNAPMVLAHDAVMRGGIGDPDADAPPPLENSAHGSAYSALHDGSRIESARLCGSCHDIVNDNGVALERTYREWKVSRHGPEGDDPRSCGDCHMPARRGSVVEGDSEAPPRDLHGHMWPGVDVALTSGFPGVDAQKQAIDCAFRDALEMTLEPVASEPPFDAFEVTIRSGAIGHAWPSGAAQDRRAWVELTAYDETDTVVFESGTIGDSERVDVDTGPDVDPRWRDDQLVILRDQLFDANAEPVHMFWLAAPSETYPDGYLSQLVPPPGDSPPARTLTFQLPEGSTAARVHVRLRLRAIGLDVFDDFAGIPLPITERDVNVAYFEERRPRSQVRTITVPGSELEWTPARGTRRLPSPEDALSTDECDAQTYANAL